MYTTNAALSTAIAASARVEYSYTIPQHQWVEVLVDCPRMTGLLTYGLPPGLEVQPGDILSVPLNTQTIGGIAIRKLSQPPKDIPIQKIKNVEDVVSSGFFPDFYWELLNRIARYYYTPLIQVIRVALPPGLLGKSQRRIQLIAHQNTPQYLSSSSLSFSLSPAARKILDLLQAQQEGNYSFVYLSRQVRGAYRAVRELRRLGLIETYLEAPRLTKPKLQKAVILIKNSFKQDLTARQTEILEVLRRRGGEMWQTELLQACSTSSSVIKTLEKKGYVVVEEKEILRTDAQDNVDETFTGGLAKNLTSAQQIALETINNINGYASILLHGVTGSGKTEVYLQAIAPLLTAGRSALVLVPEIGLTPQLTDRFRARFGSKVRVYHSALSDGERYDTWRQMLAGEAQVVIGTRSAIFAPLPNLGLIVLDEEHDSSFKQDSPIPTYHARKVAAWRAELQNCPLILGSATPSLESWVAAGRRGEGGEGEEGEELLPNAQFPKSYYLSLPERVNSRPLPPVEIVDMRSELQQGNRSIFSKSLQQGLQELVETGQQGILFIHRRGHSTFVSCRSCGYVMECPYCDVSLSYHQTEAGAAQVLRCHYCNYATPHPKNCPDCCSPYLKFFGSGTQKVAQELTKQFPDLRFIRFDSDTTRNKGAHRTLLTRFAKGEAHLLIGTQMLTKGLDLPQVTLVGVVSADGLLHLSDYRASERAFQTLTQVAGRAGRGEDPGRVIIQTYTTEHPVIEAVRQHDYQTFIADELDQREALNYPPLGRLILLRLSSLDDVQVENTAAAIAEKLQQQSEIDVLGPAPASILRVANRYRWQILLKFTAEDLPKLPNWEEIRQLCRDSVSLTIDIDPLNIM
ncbi:replication restart DNA helicase PriA [Rivularia sp. PCC 7116]|uniref:primosomal protein N' n=1 Tax=Rivularia sp. PCC 7116 TaxID=373994 RepID=UPI00029F3C61|nr:primosomal protein N' [Rivularia sp. PCC 7116]AFY57912.1 replication restart DNA helicase PriA [Rivularia sp. PCC 7116]